MEDFTEEIMVCVGALRPYGPGIVAEIESAVATLTAERDRIAAENAELIISAGLPCCVVDKLAAANATLDALREVVPESVNSRPYDVEHLRGTIWHILYPPKTTSVRDIAAAHGFDPMPADLAQRSVDGETNYVRLNTEATK